MENKPGKSWIESANPPDCHFPMQNLPYGVFSRNGSTPHCGVPIGDLILDITVLEQHGLIHSKTVSPVFNCDNLNTFMASGPSNWSSIRSQLQALLQENGDNRLQNNSELQSIALIPLTQITPHLPFHVSAYTDFYAGKQHALNVGAMFRGPENALPPNWLHIPIGYNGRASTVIVSGTDIRRPLGQMKPAGIDKPFFGPSKRLDFELELGAVVGMPNQMGRPVTVSEADDMIFGYVLLNDWSARDIQAWEYQPLGPFQGKAFATSISPWVVTKEALEPFRTSSPPRDEELLPYLREPGPMLYDIDLQIHMQPEKADQPTVLARTNYRHMYYSSAQQLAHHAISGCLMNTGDLLGSGTISGPDKTQYGSLLELSWGGNKPLTLETGENRSFIEDGDAITLTGWAQGKGFKIGFGECTGRILPALEADWF